jgi:hypothetical protein
MDVQRRVYQAVATLAAGFLATHAVRLAWRLATRDKAPEDTDDLGVATGTAVVFAGLLGAATAIAQTLAARHALKTVAQHQRPAAEATEG